MNRRNVTGRKICLSFIFIFLPLLLISCSCNSDDDDDDASADDTEGPDDTDDADDDTTGADDTDDTGDDTAGPDDTDYPDDTYDFVDDDTGPGTSGLLSITSGGIYPFSGTHVDEEPLFEITSEPDAIASYGTTIFVCGRNDMGETAIWKYDGELTKNIIMPFEEEDAYHPRALAFWGPGEDDFLLLVQVVPAFDPDRYYEYLGYYPAFEVNGLYSGFTGGAYPYDLTTIYNYNGSIATPVATVPAGQIALAKPWGTDGLVAFVDDGSVRTWDPDAGWQTRAEDLPECGNKNLLTDPEEDILVACNQSEGKGTWNYYMIESGDLVAYDVFDTSNCPSWTAALLAGSAKLFWCPSAPVGVACADTAGANSYLVKEKDGEVLCRGTNLSYQSWLSLLWVQW